jgi:hypothetical protein
LSFSISHFAFELELERFAKRSEQVDDSTKNKVQSRLGSWRPWRIVGAWRFLGPQMKNEKWKMTNGKWFLFQVSLPPYSTAEVS